MIRKWMRTAVIILTLCVIAGAQAPPLFQANAKYLGYAGAGGGTGNAQTITYSPAITVLAAGEVVTWTPSNANTSGATLNPNGLGAKTVVKFGGAALVANDLTTTSIAIALYDGTNFELVNPQTGPGAVPCSGLPALTGGVTSSAGSCATILRALVSGDIPNNAANTSGSAASLSGASALPNGTTATTQSAADNSTKVATTAYADAVLTANSKIRTFGTTFGDTGGSALTSGSVVYFTVPYACTINAWNISVDAGTATIDIWKIATGTAIPTVTNTITASALPAIASGTSIHSTTLTSWTTSVSSNDIFGFQLKTVATAKFVEVDVQCNQ